MSECNSSNNNSTMKVKVVLGNDTRRWRYTNESTLSSLNSFIDTSFNLDSFWLQYEDDEGDRLTLSTQNDFEDAFDCALNEERKSLKIYVIHGNIRNAQKRHKSKPTEPPSPTTSNPNPQQKSCSEFRAAAIDFLQNSEIIKLLPDLHRRIFEEIKKCQISYSSSESKEDDPESSKWDSPSNVEQIMRNILTTESKFKPIISHELYITKLQYCIPHFATKISNHLSFLMNFSCDAIAAWIPHITSVIGNGFMNMDCGNWTGDFNDTLGTFFPLMCSFMSHHGSNYKQCDIDENGNAIHYGVTCDECSVSPIKGVRYKCMVCGNYDLCGVCESFGKHDNKHPLIKFVNSVGCVQPPFIGLHEIMNQFGHGPHKWFGHHWKSKFNKCNKRNNNKGNNNHNNNNQNNQGQHGGGGHGFQSHHPHMGPQWGWNQDVDHHHWGRGGHRMGWKRWNRQWHQQQQQQHQQWQQQQYQSQQQPQQQQSYDNNMQQWCNNRNEHNNNNDTSSIISSTISENNNNLNNSNNKKIKVMADFVCDVTLQDRTYYPIDTVLTKTWKMRNNGEYEWGNNVELVFFKGNQSLTLEKRYPVINAKPNEEVQVSAVIKTPTKPGRYCSYYRLQRNGEYFGPRVWVDIFAVDEANPQNISKLNNNNKNKKNNNNKKKLKFEKKQLKLDAKSSKIKTELNNVNKQLDLQNENENSNKLISKQQKLQKQANKLAIKQSKLNDKKQNNSNSNNILLDENQLLDDIANAAVADLEKQLDLHAISCVCGTTLHKTSPIEAYRNTNSEVNCDICGKFCQSTSSIYHCPNGKSKHHNEGYDLCQSCGQYQMQGFIQNIQNNNQNNVSDLVVKPKHVVKQDVFKYQQELEQLRAMNIANDKKIKEELIKEKGDVQRVANKLLQLQ